MSLQGVQFRMPRDISYKTLVTVMVSVLVLPAASRAVTVNTLEPCVRGTLADQEVVPVAVVSAPVPFRHVT